MILLRPYARVFIWVARASGPAENDPLPGRSSFGFHTATFEEALARLVRLASATQISRIVEVSEVDAELVNRAAPV